MPLAFRARWTPLLLAVALTAVPPAVLPAQQRLPSQHQSFYLGVNVLLGAGEAVGRAVREHSVSRLVRAAGAGAVGGAVMYAGQRITGGSDGGVRLLGLQTTALGANIVRNAGDDVGLLSDLTFPFYPFYVRVRPRGDDRVQVRLSLLAAVTLASTLATLPPHARFDAGATLASGAPVLVAPLASLSPVSPAPGEIVRQAVGVAHTATIVYAADGPHPARTLRHESVHVAQFARDAILNAVPASDAAMRALARTDGPLARASALGRWMVLDVVLPVTWTNALLARQAGDPANTFYEREAEFMAGGDYCRGILAGECRW